MYEFQCESGEVSENDGKLIAHMFSCFVLVLAVFVVGRFLTDAMTMQHEHNMAELGYVQQVDESGTVRWVKDESPQPAEEP